MNKNKKLLKKMDGNFNKYIDSIERKEKIDNGELKELLSKLKNNKIPEKDIAHVISIFGNNHFLEARKLVEKYIFSKSEIIRYNTLVTLILDWGLYEHYKTAKKLLKDSDDEIKGLSATCIGSLKKSTKDKKSLRILIDILRNKNEVWLVRSSAYSAILDIWGISRQNQPEVLEDFEKFIDWKTIREIEYYIKMSKKMKTVKKFVINGDNFNNLEGFYDEFQNVFLKSWAKEFKMGKNLDAFDDVLYPNKEEEKYKRTIIWRNFDKSEKELPTEELIHLLEILQNHKSHITLILKRGGK